MTKYRWRNWGGNTRTVEADIVSFAHGHVVFWSRSSAGPRLVLAESNNDVNHLETVPEEAAHDDF